MCMCVFKGQWRIREAQERLDYDPNLMRCTKGLLNFHSIPVLLHNTDLQGIHTVSWHVVYSLHSKIQYDNANI